MARGRGRRVTALTKRYMLKLRGRERGHLALSTPYGRVYLPPAMRGIYKGLQQSGYDPIPQLPVGQDTATVALVLPDLRLDVEIGDAEAHAQRDQRMADRGWVVARYPEANAMSDPVGVIRDIRRRIQDAGVHWGKTPDQPTWTSSEPSATPYPLPPPYPAAAPLPPPPLRERVAPVARTLGWALLVLLLSTLSIRPIAAALVSPPGERLSAFLGNPADRMFVAEVSPPEAAAAPEVVALSVPEPPRAEVTVGEREGDTVPISVRGADRLEVEVWVEEPGRACWVRVMNGTERIAEGLLRGGSRLAWTAGTSTWFRAGNPGVMHVRINGQDLGIPTTNGPYNFMVTLEQ